MEYGLIGEKLGHSYSKLIQEKLLDNYTYELHPIAKEDVDAFMKEKSFKAINVTIPYKQTVIPYLDEMDDAAKKIGAVNTIVNTKGVLKGFNTDYYGFKYTLEHHNITIKDKKVLVMGNGGASKAIQAVIKDKEAREMLVVDIVLSEGILSIEEVYEKHSDVDVIVNTTPLGMYPKVDACCIDFSKFKNVEAAVDVVYNPFATEFALQAQDHNIKAVTGLEMLVAQAKYALEYFKDIKIDDKEIDRIYKEILASTTNLICIDKKRALSAATLLKKEFIDMEEIKKTTKNSVENISREIGVQNDKVIYCPITYRNDVVMRNLIRNGFVINSSDTILSYKYILNNL